MGQHLILDMEKQQFLYKQINNPKKIQTKQNQTCFEAANDYKTCWYQFVMVCYYFDGFKPNSTLHSIVHSRSFYHRNFFSCILFDLELKKENVLLSEMK